MVSLPTSASQTATARTIPVAPSPRFSARQVSAGWLFTLLALLFWLLMRWILALAPETHFDLAPGFRVVPLALSYHALAGLLAARLLCSRRPDVPPLLCGLWLFVGLAGSGLNRGSGAAFGALCALLLAPFITFVFRCLKGRNSVNKFSSQTAAGGQDERLRASIAAALLLSATGLVVLANASSRQLATQLPWFCLTWLLVAHPWSGPLLGRLLSPPRHPAKRGVSLFAFGLGLLLLNIFLKRLTNSPYPTISIGGFSFQPFLGTLVLCLLAETALFQTGRPIPLLFRALAITMLLVLGLGEMGTALIYWASLASWSAVLTGWSSRTKVLAWCGLFLALGLTAATFQSRVPILHERTAHIRQRVEFLRGDNSNAELARMNTAIAQAGWLGRFGAARSWLLSERAAKDYAPALLCLHLGFCGLLFVLACYAVLLNGLFRVALGLREPFAQRTALLLVVLLALQTLLPLLGQARIFLTMGIPALGIGRGGSYLLCFGLTLALLRALSDYRSPQNSHDFTTQP